MKILGCDPGLSGALALLDTDQPGKILTVLDMPVVSVKAGTKTKNELNLAVLTFHIAGLAPDHAFVELVHAMPGQGVSSMFRFGEVFGALKGILSALAIPTTLVPPATWTRVMQVKGDEGSILRVSQLFPGHGGMFARKKDHGRADATLIALYGQRSLNL